MKYRKNQRVRDKWWPLIQGKIIKVLKTRIYVCFEGRLVRYDKAHSKFLELV